MSAADAENEPYVRTTPPGILSDFRFGPVEDPAAAMERAIELNKGHNDGRDFERVLGNLEICAEEPTMALYPFLRTWSPTRETERLLPERSESHIEEDGIHYEGEVDAHGGGSINMLLHGLYGITGAEIVRNDLVESPDKGVIVRKGEYKGSTVYFEEIYDALSENSIYFDPEVENQKGMVLRIHGSESGEAAAKQLTPAQLEDFAYFFQVDDVKHFVGNFGPLDINQDNFRALMSLIVLTRESLLNEQRDEQRESSRPQEGGLSRAIKRFASKLVSKSVDPEPAQ